MLKVGILIDTVCLNVENCIWFQRGCQPDYCRFFRLKPPSSAAFMWPIRAGDGAIRSISWTLEKPRYSDKRQHKI